MRIAVVGGMGAVAREVAVQAMEAGHFVSWHLYPSHTLEDPSLESDYTQVLRIVRGAWDDEQQYMAALSTCDAVVVVLDQRYTKPEQFVPIQRLVQRSMRSHGLERIVLVTAHGSGDSNRQLDWMHWARFNVNQALHSLSIASGLLCWSVAAQYSAQEAVLAADASLKYTVLRPATVTDGPATGTYLASPTHVFGGYISAADVADCALKALSHEMDISQAFSLAYSSRVA
ncbi:hypothetical protein IWQ56_003844 [Coemansia nantahalensis]|nr:hypothetical protein IWQ56_003844 [Coemansia nantahalensis]